MKWRKLLGKKPRRLWAELRKLGFKRTYQSQAGGVPLVHYEKQVDCRRVVQVQIWDDGCYRASSSFLGCSDTPPTTFTNFNAMKESIQFESDRMDSNYAKPGSLATERVV